MYSNAYELIPLFLFCFFFMFSFCFLFHFNPCYLCILAVFAGNIISYLVMIMALFFFLSSSSIYFCKFFFHFILRYCCLIICLFVFILFGSKVIKLHLLFFIPRKLHLLSFTFCDSLVLKLLLLFGPILGFIEFPQ